MDYQNKLPREGINVSKEHPLKVFSKYVAASALLIVTLLIGLNWGGGYLAKKVPFAVERDVMAALNIDFGTRASPDMEQYLNELSRRLAVHLPVPEGMTFKVHYSDESVFNAFATIGGNLLFYRGLLERMPNENALAMVVAHELSHVIHRDPIAGAGGGLTSAVALSMLMGRDGIASRFISWTGMATSMSFTRGMETSADTAALAAIVAEYGHVEGADTLFRLIGDLASPDSKTSSPDWLTRFSQTHPLDSDRIAAIDAFARDNGWPTTGELTPLPENFQQWLKAR